MFLCTITPTDVLPKANRSMSLWRVLDMLLAELIEGTRSLSHQGGLSDLVPVIITQNVPPLVTGGHQRSIAQSRVLVFG